MPINMEINIESFLENLRNLAPVMVDPDRLAPGNKANDCQHPIINASVFVKSVSVLICLDLSATYKNTENTILANAIIANCLEKSINKKVSRSNAVIIIGIAEINKGILKLEPCFSVEKKPKDSIIISFNIIITASKLPKWTAMSNCRLFFVK